MKVPVAGLLGLSSVDYPGRPAAVIFTPGCNFRCPFCQNWQILDVKPEHKKDIGEILRFIDDASLTIEAVKITGGEPTLYPELIRQVSKHCHQKGLLFGFDTNGFQPGLIAILIPYADMISLDLKASPARPDLMEKLVGLPGKGRQVVECIMTTLNELMSHKEVYLDIRTTVVPGLNDEATDFERIGELLKSLNYEERAIEKTASYTLQEFLPEHARDENIRRIRSTSASGLVKLASATHLRDVYIKHRDLGFMVHVNQLGHLKRIQ